MFCVRGLLFACSNIVNQTFIGNRASDENLVLKVTDKFEKNLLTGLHQVIELSLIGFSSMV